MPTIRPTKRLLLPTDGRERTVFEQVVADQSELAGCSTSDAIISDVLASALPGDGPARRHAESVFSGAATVLGDAASLLRENCTGPVGLVERRDYLCVLRYATEAIGDKGLSTALDNGHPLMSHAIECMGDAIEALSRGAGPEDPDAARWSRHGRALLAEVDHERFSRGPAAALVKLAVDAFDRIGPLNCTCSYVADVLQVLDESEAAWRADGCLDVGRDSAATRLGWVDVLEEFYALPIGAAGESFCTAEGTAEDGARSEWTPPAGCCVRVEWSEESLGAAGVGEDEIRGWVERVFERLGVPTVAPNTWGWLDGDCRVGDDRHMALVVAAHLLVSGSLSRALSRVLTSEGAGYDDLLAYHRAQMIAVRHDS